MIGLPKLDRAPERFHLGGAVAACEQFECARLADDLLAQKSVNRPNSQVFMIPFTREVISEGVCHFAHLPSGACRCSTRENVHGVYNGSQALLCMGCTIYSMGLMYKAK